MTSDRSARNFLRDRKEGEHGKVTFIELFFDLVFVFAITQLSHTLLAHPTPGGAIQTLLLFMAVWWVWIFTSWVTNWLDPEHTPVRLMLLALMLVGLVLSTSIPEAFGESGLVFAGAYVTMQVGRSLFTMWSLRTRSPANYRNFQRISAWLAVSGVFWIAGGLAEETTRFALWAVALAIEYAGPSLGFHTPGLGRSTTTDWDVEGGHLAERCALFVIIALGESILVTGATFGDQSWTAGSVAAFVTAFVGSVAMWWIYFDTAAERGSHHIAASDGPGRLARLSYTYVHLLLVAGIIVGAVADELVLAHPGGHVETATALAVLGGPALYVLGNALFKLTITGRLPLSHLAGLALFGALALPAMALTPLLLAIAATLVLIVVAVWERISFRTPKVATIHE